MAGLVGRQGAVDAYDSGARQPVAAMTARRFKSARRVSSFMVKPREYLMFPAFFQRYG